MHKLIVLCLCLILSSCSTQRQEQNTQLILRIENRDIVSDTINEYRFFADGTFNSTTIHSSNAPEKLYQSSFKKLSKIDLDQVLKFHEELRKLDYHNDFPWKEDFYKRGNVVRIEFADTIKLNYPPSTGTETVTELLSPQIYYYYTGHEDSPALFKNLMQFVNKLDQ